MSQGARQTMTFKLPLKLNPKEENEKLAQTLQMK